jgi:hypothetical protein
MVVGDNTPVWSDLGQTQSVRHKLPGRPQSWCGSDVYGESCPPEELFGLGMGVPGHENVMRYASDNSSEMFGMGEDAVFGQVLFPNIKRADYAINPLSGLGTVRIPDTDSLGTVRVPDSSDAFNGLGQVLFPNIKRADYAINPLSGFGTVRIPDMDSFGYMGQDATPATTAPGAAAGTKAFIGNWGLAPWLAAAALLGGAYFAKGNLKALLQGMGVVAGGMGAVQLVGKLTK